MACLANLPCLARIIDKSMAIPCHPIACLWTLGLWRLGWFRFIWFAPSTPSKYRFELRRGAVPHTVVIIFRRRRATTPIISAAARFTTTTPVRFGRWSPVRLISVRFRGRPPVRYWRGAPTRVGIVRIGKGTFRRSGACWCWPECWCESRRESVENMRLIVRIMVSNTTREWELQLLATYVGSGLVGIYSNW